MISGIVARGELIYFLRNRFRNSNLEYREKDGHTRLNSLGIMWTVFSDTG